MKNPPFLFSNLKFEEMFYLKLKVISLGEHQNFEVEGYDLKKGVKVKMDGNLVSIPFEELNFKEGEDLGFEDDFGGSVRSVAKEIEVRDKKIGLADEVIDEIEKSGMDLWEWEIDMVNDFVSLYLGRDKDPLRWSDVGDLEKWKDDKGDLYELCGV